MYSCGNFLILKQVFENFFVASELEIDSSERTFNFGSNVLTYTG